jgi:hypothetical protein
MAGCAPWHTATRLPFGGGLGRSAKIAAPRDPLLRRTAQPWREPCGATNSTTPSACYRACRRDDGSGEAAALFLAYCAFQIGLTSLSGDLTSSRDRSKKRPRVMIV